MIQRNARLEPGFNDGAAELRTFAWTDPVSGERLTIRMHGARRFFDALEPLGFAALGQSERPTREAASRRAWVSVREHLTPEERTSH